LDSRCRPTNLAQPQPNPTSIYNTIERPILSNNPNVNIIEHII